MKLAKHDSGDLQVRSKIQIKYGGRMRLRLGLSIVLIFVSGAAALGQRYDLSLIRSAGDGGPATKAPLYGPTGLAIGGNYLYIVEAGAKRLRRVDLKTGIITTLAGGGKQCPKSDEQFDPGLGCFDDPQRVAVDSVGNVYVTNDGPEAIVEIAAKTHSYSIITAATVRLLPNGGPEKRAKLDWPAGIAISSSGALYFDDYTRHTVYGMTLSDDRLEVIAGTGKEGSWGDGRPARKAALRFPDGLAVDANGNLFIADSGNCRIERVDSQTGILTTLTGTGERGATCELRSDYDAPLDQPSDLAVKQNGDIYFVLPSRQRVERFDPRTRVITTIAGNGEEGFTGDGGPATQAKLHFPEGIALDKTGNLFIADTDNGRVRRVDAKTGIITTVAGNGPISSDIML